jgi:nucleoside-diphosphate-sugar epimerase
MRQSILVLGASGFIGQRVVKALAASDWAVPVSASRRAMPAGSGTRHIQLDATDAKQLSAAMAGISGVVNCVAGSAQTIVESARAVFSVAAGLKEKPRIVHLSSMAVYGGMGGEVQESTPLTAELSPYGAAKLESERLAPANLSVVILRPGIVYGPDSAQWSERIARLLFAHRLGDLGRAGDGYCNLVYIDDTVAAILRALQRPNLDATVFNLSLPAPPTWNEYFVRYAQALGAVPVSRITARRLRIESKLLAPPQKIAEIIAGKVSGALARALPPPMPPSLVRLFAQEIRMNVAAAESGLGIGWTSLDDGLKRTADWYNAASANPK